MSKKDRFIEWFKTGLIILLLAFTVFLLWHTQYYDNAFQYISGVFISTRESIQASNSTETNQTSNAQIEPMAVSVFLGTGSRYASIYDRESIQADYQRFSAYIAEALGSSGEPVKVGHQSWLDALGKESVYFRFITPQPLSVLSNILGAKMSSSAGQALSDELCLSCDEQAVGLYYKTDDGYYYCDTGVSVEALRARLTEFVPNGAYFSHETSSLAGLNDSMLVPQSLPPVRTVISGNPVSGERMKELLFSAFEINEYSVSEYTESDGTTVYLAGSGSFHISPGGIAEYFCNEHSEKNAAPENMEQIFNICWNLVISSVGANADMADIYFSHIEQEDGTSRIYFSYSINSIPISLAEGGYAAMFEFAGSSLSYVRLCFRSFALGEDTLGVLPLLQAVAIASANGNDRIQLTYSESGVGINCVWVPQ